MKEEEAKKKECQIRRMSNLIAYGVAESHSDIADLDFHCVGSACMQWERWEAEDEGDCGLKPSSGVLSVHVQHCNSAI